MDSDTGTDAPAVHSGRMHDLDDLISFSEFAARCGKPKTSMVHLRDRRDHPTHPTGFPHKLTTAGGADLYSYRELRAWYVRWCAAHLEI
jgi:hypothetical protein